MPSFWECLTFPTSRTIWWFWICTHSHICFKNLYLFWKHWLFCLSPRNFSLFIQSQFTGGSSSGLCARIYSDLDSQSPVISVASSCWIVDLFSHLFYLTIQRSINWKGWLLISVTMEQYVLWCADICRMTVNRLSGPNHSHYFYQGIESCPINTRGFVGLVQVCTVGCQYCDISPNPQVWDVGA